MAGPLDRLEASDETISPTRAILAGTLPFFISWWFIIIPGVIFVRALYRRYASPLRKYPGPWLASTTRLWKVISTASTRTHLEHIELHKKYGPIVRIAPDEVSLSSPEAARTLLSAGKRFYKTKFYSVFPPVETPDIFTELREDIHARKKKVANVPYGMAAMQQLSPFIDDTIDLLFRKMDAAAAGLTDASINAFPKGSVVDLGNWLHWFAFDVLGEVAFSRKFGFLEQGRDVDGAIHAIDESQRYSGIVGQVSFLDCLLRRNPLWMLMPGMGNKHAPISRLALDELSRRKPFDKESEGKWKGGDGRRDLLASLIRSHLEDPGRFSEGDVFAVAHGAIFAGSDSTASTMQSLFWHIFNDARVYARIQEEISTAVERGTIPASGNISWAEAHNLDYFQACLKESMRVRPAVGLDMVRMVPPEGAELDGEFLPGGVSVAVNGWVLHRDKAIFGEDADIYRPERWLGNEESTKRMERYMFQFGGGSHLCIGRNLALLEMNKVCPRLLRDYHFELVHPGRELRAHCTFFVVQEGLEVYISRKQQ
ncbi:hypothetical protein VPNG_00689 [Cytospora leucostoma]|uniref:Uncharacterized protein n=1 Tax=Cytospora leucostoma TaxID=1230097 RepID=A0A423XMI6_9PEZI|nr:hypothetical protein VPNG_00689 [Cytospora leucostoma]